MILANIPAIAPTGINNHTLIINKSDKVFKECPIPLWPSVSKIEYGTPNARKDNIEINTTIIIPSLKNFFDGFEYGLSMSAPTIPDIMKADIDINNIICHKRSSLNLEYMLCTIKTNVTDVKTPNKP